VRDLFLVEIPLFLWQFLVFLFHPEDGALLLLVARAGKHTIRRRPGIRAGGYILSGSDVSDFAEKMRITIIQHAKQTPRAARGRRPDFKSLPMSHG
jgi:hypothetical protein